MGQLDGKPARYLGLKVSRWLAAVTFVIGGALGFAAGVTSVKEGRDFLRSLWRYEQRADTSSRKVVNRPGFRFEFPGNWQIDTTEAKYDPDHWFSIHSSGQSVIMFFIADGVASAPRGVLDQHVAAQMAKVLRGAKRTDFVVWGKYAGEGALLSGRYLGLVTGTVRVFVFLAAKRTYTIVESTYDEDRASVEPGFHLIERTFQVEEAAGE